MFGNNCFQPVSSSCSSTAFVLYIFYTMLLFMQVCSLLIAIKKIMAIPAPLHYVAE
jgi:hypothetical protein